MAEQEAGTKIISSGDRAKAETKVIETTTTISGDQQNVQGESLLLPLLKELLDKQGNTDSVNRPNGPLLRTQSSQSCSDESGHTGTGVEDSGTESGEDLRLIAAGLCNSIQNNKDAKSTSSQVEPLSTGLLTEVFTALNKLQNSLQHVDDFQDVSLDPTRRLALLHLVSRLQEGLLPPPPVIKPPTADKPASQSRFANRRERKNRHTVGVSQEELADARRLMEEMVIRDSLTSNQNEKANTGYVIQKQSSDGDVQTNNNVQIGHYKPVHFTPKTYVKNTVPRPFHYDSGPVVTTPKQDEDQESVHVYENVETKPIEENKDKDEEQHDKVGFTRQISTGSVSNHEDVVKIKAIHSAVHKAALLKQASMQSESGDYNSEDEENDNAEENDNTEERYATPVPDIGPEYITEPHDTQNTYTINTDETIHIPENNDTGTVSNDEVSRKNSQDLSKPLNRFNNKKMRIKRANTIDIPKPLNFYQVDDDSDCSITDYDEKSVAAARKNTYLALRGPIRVGDKNTNVNVVPTLEPKTESDKKFLAFLNKQENKADSWQNVNNTENQNKNNNWSNTFGNLKTIFEKTNKFEKRSSSVPSTKKIWQTADDSTMRKQSYHGPKISKEGNKFLTNLFEHKQQHSKLPWAGQEVDVVSGSLRIDPNLRTGDQASVANKTIKFVQQPAPVNKFSHNPMSPFKPPPKKIQQNHPPFLLETTPGTAQSWAYTSVPSTGIVKHITKNSEFGGSHPIQNSEYREPFKPKNISNIPTTVPMERGKSPLNTAPWLKNSEGNEKRVLNLVNSKFENHDVIKNEIPQQKIVEREKVYVPPIIKETFTHPSYKVENQQAEYNEHYNQQLSSPQLVQRFQNNNDYGRTYNYQYNGSQQPYVTDNVQYRPANNFRHDEHSRFQEVSRKQNSPPSTNIYPPVYQNHTYTQPIQNHTNYDDSYKGNYRGPQQPSLVDSYTRPAENNFNNEIYQQQYRESPVINKLSIPYSIPNNDYHNENDSFQQISNTDSPASSDSYFPETYQDLNSISNIVHESPIYIPKQTLNTYIQGTVESIKTDEVSPQDYNSSMNMLSPDYRKEFDTTNINKYVEKDKNINKILDYNNYVEKDMNIDKVQNYKNYIENDKNKDNIQDYNIYVTKDKNKDKLQDYNNYVEKDRKDDTMNGYTGYVENITYSTQNISEPIQNPVKSEMITKPEPLKIFDYPSPEPISTNSSISENNEGDIMLPNFMEYKTVTKVMKAPISQTAVTVTQKVPRRRDEDFEMALNLRSALQRITTPENELDKKSPTPIKNLNSPHSPVPPPIPVPVPRRRGSLDKGTKPVNEKKIDRLSYQPVNSSEYSDKNIQDESKKVYPQYVNTNEKIQQVKPIPRGAQIKTLNERGIPYEEPRVSGNVTMNTTNYQPPPQAPLRKTKDTQPNSSQIQNNVRVQQNTSHGKKVENVKQYQEHPPLLPKPKPKPDQTKINNKSNSQAAVSYDFNMFASQNYSSPPQSRPEPPRISKEPRLSTQSIELNEQGESVVTSKLQIPVGEKFLPHIVSRTSKNANIVASPSRSPNKFEAWNQIVQQQQATKPPSPRSSPRSRYLLQKAKSSHSIVPKQFEAGITKDEIVKKKLTVEAYFNGSRSPQPTTKTALNSFYEPILPQVSKTSVKSAINRTKTTNKVSTQRYNTPLTRSKTMPHVAVNDVTLLDETNVDEAFEDLFKESI